MQKARKNLASWFAHNKVKFCKQLLCQSYKESILDWILCKTTKMILHAARTKWAKSLQFKFKHVPSHCILGDIWKLIQAPQGTHFAFAFVSKLANHFHLPRQLQPSGSVQKWFKVCKVRILPSLLSQTLQIICLLPNQFEAQTRDSGFRRYASYLQF